MEETVHREGCNLIQNKEIHEKLILWPRGTFKSTIVSVASTIQEILRDPNTRILLVSDTFTQSKKWIRVIQNHLKYNPTLKLLYGEFISPDRLWTDSAFIVSQRDDMSLTDPTVQAAGVGTNVVGSHYPIIKCDDLVNKDNVSTKDQIVKVIEYWQLLDPVLEPGGYMDVVGTRWHFNDLYSYILDQTKSEIYHFTIMQKKAIADDGTLFFPQRLSKEILDAKLAKEGPTIFSAQYQNEPLSSEDAVFIRKEAKEIYWDLTTESAKDIIGNAQRPLRILITCDPAAREKDTSDNTCVMVSAVDTENILYVLDYVIGRWADPKFIIDAIYKAYDQWKHLTKYPIRIGIESVGFQNLLL